ncbi:hypothetical protein QBC34DRAFT_438656 [Podospora aff. communis PSN243]|uniref:Uncharacterized protein n=1 Tax=Podospora aff. communis PSN243 TaxID=3040156 RepID=A0AAV9GLK1_9PEZI|nr:hypothetical protein QBC34DRAFT_438656 [Podospora aff. communis PSN243]
MDSPTNSKASLLAQSDTNYGCDEPPKGPGAQGTQGSIYLHRASFASMGIFFIVLLAIFETLNFLCNRDNGLADAPSGSQYLWRYGPTLVLIIIAAFWGQIEYHILKSEPWIQLRIRPQPAETNVMLNYVSPWNITSLSCALRACHWAVAIAIGGGLILKALVVVSTGLFVVEDRQFTVQTEFQLTHRLDLSRLYNNTDIAEPRLDPGVAFWAVNAQNVPYPAGVNSEYAVAPFSAEALDLPVGATLQANTTVFAVTFDCPAFSWTYNTRGKKSASKILASLDDQDLFSLADMMSTEDFELLSSFFSQALPRPDLDPVPSLTNNASSRWLNRTTLVDTYWDPFGYATDFTTVRPENNTGRIFTSLVVDRPANRSDVTALLCRPLYSLTRRPVSVTIGANGNILQVSDNIIETLNLGITPSLLTALSFGIMFPIRQTFFGDTNLGRLPDNWWIPIMNITTPKKDWSEFFEKEVFSAAFQRALRELMVWCVRHAGSTALQDGAGRLPGFIVTPRPRVVVTQITLRVMEALLAVMATISLALCMYGFGPSGEYRGSLLHAARLVVSSDQMSHLLGSKGGLSGYLFSSDPISARIDASWDTALNDTADASSGAAESTPLAPERKMTTLNKSSDHVVSWLPLAMTKAFRLSVLAITLAFLVTLEALLQVSRKNNGLAEVPTQGYVQYAWNVFPALLLASLGLAYVSMDRAMRTLHPFLELTQRGGAAVETLTRDSQANIAVVALALSVYRRQPGLSFIILASTLATLMAIISNGLYSATGEGAIMGKTTDVDTWFDIRNASLLWDKYYNYSGGHLRDTLFSQAIQAHNLTYTAGTYQGFAFAMPNLAGIPLAPGSASPTGKFKAQVPAARFQSNCELLEFRPVDEQAVKTSGEVEISVFPPPGCYKGANSTRTSRLDRLFLDPPLLPYAKPGPFGFLAQTDWGAERLPGEFNFTANLRLPHEVCADNIQHLFFVYGTRSATTNATENTAILHCIPSLESIVVSATFLLPSQEIDPSSSLEVVPDFAPTEWTAFNETSIPLPMPGFTTASADDNFDAYFTFLRYGPSFANLSPSIPELIAQGDSPSARAEILSRINSLCQELAAQSLHFNFRVPYNKRLMDPEQPQPQGGTINGTLFLQPPPGRARLVQNEIPTRVLEGVLITLLVLAAASFALVGWRDRAVRVLERDPGSIAARIGLWVGSGFVEEMRNGKKRWEGRRFKLGWWDGEPNSGERGRYGIDVMPREGPGGQ